MRSTRNLVSVCVLALAGCRGVTLAEFDAMHDQLETRTVLREERFTLWSPLDAVTSRAWADVIERQSRAVEAAFGLAPSEDARLQLVLERTRAPIHKLPAPGESVTISVHHRGSRNGVLGHASGNTVKLFIGQPMREKLSDGTVATREDDPEVAVSTLNHELAHVAMHRARLAPPTWLSEGAADVVESLALEPAGLCDVGIPAEELEGALELDKAEWSLARLFAWREDGARVESGAERANLPMRRLCGLYVRWLLDLKGDGAPVTDLAARFRELAARPEGQLLAGESAWRAWREARLAGR